MSYAPFELGGRVAVASLNKSLAVERAQRGVNAIAPGVFRTALKRRLRPLITHH
jgi:NAD(P)-dependent dehydrogenase (short-subunit alcohol dehydrogenase family)